MVFELERATLYRTAPSRIDGWLSWQIEQIRIALSGVTNFNGFCQINHYGANFVAASIYAILHDDSDRRSKWQTQLKGDGKSGFASDQATNDRHLPQAAEAGYSQDDEGDYIFSKKSKILLIIENRLVTFEGPPLLRAYSLQCQEACRLALPVFLFIGVEERVMNRQLISFSLGILTLIYAGSGVQAQVLPGAIYGDVYWVGGDGEWTGDVTANPEYSTGNWSTDPNATSGVPAKFVFGRNDGIRVNQVIGPGGFDLDRVPCNEPGCTTGNIPGGTQAGTDIYINKPVTVFYNPNRMFLTGDDGLDRFGDFRVQASPDFPGTPTLNLSNGAVFEHQTTSGGDIDGMWTRWNGAELNLDNATFRRTGDPANGFASGAWMFASFHGFDNSVQSVNLKNGSLFYNEGQAWFGQSSFDLMDGNAAGIRVVVTINDGHMDFTKGDEYGLDNDGLFLRSDLAFVYDHKPDGDTNPDDDEVYIINFTGPGSITVDGDNANPLDGDTTTGGGGIRVARQTGTTHPREIDGQIQEVADYVGGDTQVSYQDLWDMGILRAHGKSGLDGETFNDYFTVANNPGDTDYKLTSIVVPLPETIPGDYNRDGSVDAADYLLLRKGSLLADGNGSMHIDPVDEMIWRKNFGLSSAGSGSGGVPEPGTALLTLIGMAALCVLRRSR